MSSLLLIAFAVTLLSIFPEPAQASGIIDKEQFHDALGRALNSTREFESREQRDGRGGGSGRNEEHGTANESLADGGMYGAWRIIPQGHFYIEVFNHGDSMALWLNLQLHNGNDADKVFAAITKMVGDSKPKQIAECYHHFMDDWCRDMHKKATKVFERNGG
jgi:hypothetical protein